MPSTAAGDTGDSYTNASWYRWFLDPANRTSSSIVGKSFRSYCSFGCQDDGYAEYTNITIDSDSPAQPVDTTKKYTIANADGRLLATSGNGRKLLTVGGVTAKNGAWRFTATGDGAYTISAPSGAVLGVDGSSKTGRAWGAALTLTPTHGAGVGQQWFIVPATDPASGEATGDVRLVNRYSGLVLGIDRSTAATTPGRSWTKANEHGRPAASHAGDFTRAGDQTLSLRIFTARG